MFVVSEAVKSPNGVPFAVNTTSYAGDAHQDYCYSVTVPYELIAEYVFKGPGRYLSMNEYNELKKYKRESRRDAPPGYAASSQTAARAEDPEYPSPETIVVVTRVVALNPTPKPKAAKGRKNKKGGIRRILRIFGI